MEARTLSFPFPFVYYRLYPPFFTSPPFPSSPFSPTGCLACLLGPLKPRKASRQAPDLPSAPFLPSSLSSASPSTPARPVHLHLFEDTHMQPRGHAGAYTHPASNQHWYLSQEQRAREAAQSLNSNPPLQALRKFHCSTAGRELTGNLVVGGSCSRHPWPWERRHPRGYGELDMFCVISGVGGVRRAGLG